jgi:hypothetical protein
MNPHQGSILDAARRRPREWRRRNFGFALGLCATLSCGACHAALGDRDLNRPAGIVLRDVAAESGVHFRLENGTRGKHDLPEIMGGGLALFDADGDGRIDVYFCNGGAIDGAFRKAPGTCRLFRNCGDWRFQDISALASAPGPGYAMGAAVGDYDGDGRLDLFVTGWRDQRLYRNKACGRFEDVTRDAGLTSDYWSTSAAFADLDGDGDLDLYVTTYLDYEAASAPYCAAPDGRRDYCGPEAFPAQPDQLFRNNGNGTFTNVAVASGIDRPGGRGLGVLIADLNGDSRPDIFVANDGSPCWLFVNQGNLHFEEAGALAGVALDGRGQALAGMGIALADADGDGLSDLFVTNFYDRSTIAFQALARPTGTYRDHSDALGVTTAMRGLLGFGVALVDFDGDGWTDLIQTNGHVLDRARLGVPFSMRPSLLKNSGGRFLAAPGRSGEWFARPMLGRGLAIGDLDGDNRPDVVASAIDAPAALLRNLSGGGRFLSLNVHDRAGRPAVGARVRVRAGGRAQVGQVTSGGSYLASSQPRLFFGLGPATVDRIEVDWPWGPKEVWAKPTPPESGPLLIRQGTGEPE